MKKSYFFLLGVLLLFSQGVSAQCITHYSDPAGYTPAQLQNKNILAVDGNGDPWVGFHDIGAGKFDGTNWTIFDRTNSGLPGNNVLSIAFMGADTWIGTDSGLVRYDGSTWTLFDISNSGILDNRVLLLYADGSDLWLAFTGGLQHFDGMSWTTYTQASGLASNTVQCMTKAGSSMFFGTPLGLSEWDGATWTTHHISTTGTGRDNIHQLCADASGTLFILPQYSPIFYKSGTDFKTVAGEMPLYYLSMQNALLLPSANGSVLLIKYWYDYAPSPLVTEYTGSPFTFAFYDCPVFTRPDSIQLIGCSSSGRLWGIPQQTGSLYSADYLTSPITVPLPPDYGELNINQVRVRLMNDGIIPQYEVPKGQVHSSLYSNSFWMGGLDASGNLHMAGQTYRQSGYDFWPGPIDTVTVQSDSLSSAQYDKIWVVDRWTINDFISNFNAGNVTNGTYTIPNVIQTWPGNGSGNFDHYLAPFVDVVVDGIYDPLDGDYPLIRGDQMAWWIMNDVLHPHTETGGLPFGVEIQVSAYAYNCPLIPDSDRVINYTTFYSYKIINRSINQYHDVYLGSYADVDLGLFMDDFVGCNVTQDFGYGYNGDNFDETINGYGSMPPVINLAVLQGPRADMTDAIDNNHDGTIDEPGESCMMQYFQYFNNDFTPYGNPETDFDYYNYLTGRWKDSTVITYGGNGHNGLDTCRYMFPGDSDPTGIGTNGIPMLPWDEYITGNTPSDRRFIVSSGPITLSAGAVNYLDYAIVYSRDENAVNYPQDVLARNASDVQKIKSWWTSGNFPGACTLSIGTNDLEHTPLAFSVYPNPFDNGFDLRFTDGLPGKACYELRDITGRLLLMGEIPASGKTHIAAPDLARGMYFVHVYDGNQSATAKLIRK